MGKMKITDTGVMFEDATTREIVEVFIRLQELAEREGSIPPRTEEERLWNALGAAGVCHEA